jgi:zinc-binding alcohol dehydrogenase family protein
MKAIGYQKSLPVEDAECLLDIELPAPKANGRDLLVEVLAVSVNPVDAKMRMRSEPPSGEYQVLGWDVAGKVVEAGPQCEHFKSGDEVFYAGSIARPGANAELHLVDERIVGPKPASLDFCAAAALPLTSITAWEVLFDRLDIRRPVAGAANAILIIGGAGGVGSMAIQLARTLSEVTVIASASRDETRDWVESLGAHLVVNHREPLAPQVAALGIGAPAFVLCTTQTNTHYDDIVELIAPQGRFALIDDPTPFDVTALKRKSVSLHWELMFTRSLFETADMAEQHGLLVQVSKLVDAGKLKTTMTGNFGTINAANLKRAHALLESGSARGKIVLEGF